MSLSLVVSILLSYVSACSPASLHTSAISAPENPSESDPSLSKTSMAHSECYILEMLILNISFLVSLSGNGTKTSLSKRPGLSSAESMMSSLLVAATTMTWARDSTPSISFSSWHRALSETLVSSSPR